MSVTEVYESAMFTIWSFTLRRKWHGYSTSNMVSLTIEYYRFSVFHLLHWNLGLDKKTNASRDRIKANVAIAIDENSRTNDSKS